MTAQPLKNRFRFIPAEFPELEDDSYELIVNQNIHIQCCESGQFIVQQLFNWDTDEAYIQSLYSSNSLASAMRFAACV